MKKLFLTLILPLLALATGSCSKDSNEGDKFPLDWSLDNGTLTISGQGDMPNTNTSFSYPWHGLRSEIKNIVIESGVTNIGYDAFTDCSSLTNVTCLAIVPPTLDRENFDALVGGDTLHVPAESVTAYKNQFSWKTAFENIVAIEE